MALSFVQYVADGIADTFNIPFPYLSQSHIQVKVDGVLDGSVTFPTSATVKTATVPANGAVVEVRRKTPTDDRIVDFQDGSLLGESDLDTSALQNFFVMQETYDDLVNKLGLGATGKWDANSKIIQNLLDGVDANDAVTVGQVLALVTSGQSINFPPLTGDALKFFQVRADETGYQHTFLGALAALNTVSNSDIDADAIDGSKIADDAINSEHLVDGSIDEQHLADDAVTTNKIADTSVTKAKLGDDVSLLKIKTRQTVLTGRVDSEGKANFIEADSGLNARIVGSATPIYATFADGFYDNGAIDYLGKLDYDGVVGVQPNQVNFLFGEYSFVSPYMGLGSTIVPPLYGPVLDTSKHSLLHFEGPDTSTTIDDEFENIWTVNGNAQLTTSDSQFGSSCLSLDGVNSYLTNDKLEVTGERWTIEFWVKFNDTNIRTLLNINYGILLNWDTSKLRIWLGDGIGSWTIASAQFGATTLNTGQWYHLALEYDGSDYRIYIDGNVDLTIASTSYIGLNSPLALGATASGSSPINALIDEFRVTVGAARYGAPFTPPAGSFSPDVYWFDTNSYKMQYGGPNNWQYKQLVFLGEAETDASSVTGTVAYALNGKASLKQDPIVASTNYYLSHNIGTRDVVIEDCFEFIKQADQYNPGDRIKNYYNYYSSASWGFNHGIEDRNTLFVRTSGSSGVITGNKFGGITVGSNFSEMRWLAEVRRIF